MQRRVPKKREKNKKKGKQQQKRLASIAKIYKSNDASIKTAFVSLIPYHMSIKRTK